MKVVSTTIGKPVKIIELPEPYHFVEKEEPQEKPEWIKEPSRKKELEPA